MKNSNIIFQAVLVFLVLALSAFLLRSCEKNNLLEQQKKAIADTTKIYRNKANELVAEKLAFAGDKQDLEQEIKRLKSEGYEIKTKLISSTKHITILNREIEIAKSGKVRPSKTDTVYIADVVIEKPEISIDTGDAFHHFKFASSSDKYAYEIKIFDNSELKVDDNGRKGTKVTLLNKNPYVSSVDIKSVMIAPKKDNVFNKAMIFGLVVVAGFFVFK